ncbi:MULTISPECIES: aminotransferase class IV [Blautia]|jgi:4-amino-4-deoxychorismate lyase|uniref:aminotransferase class IV n=1 Tax=Blautia TaxID=572511 RepID=UPI000E4BDFD6|nr:MULTISPECIES: aminotransferase class IV [Blautia]NSG18075.1 branched-chain amino acid aminotransferase [Blautia obeum]NSG38240.1 branched-chain amino acid aminotransferase [Blautia obeum]RGG64684.1 branched-chain amino acid aminotransferase [Blautia sp. AF19-10LB]
MDIKLDEGFQFGLGAFETIAVEEGRPILLDRHLRRLERAAAFFGFGPASVRGVTEEAVHKFIADQSEEETRHGAVKVVLSGENVLFQMRGNPYTEEKYLRGFVADISKVKRNETSQLVYHKTLNYGDCILEKRAATAAGIQERVFLNTKGQICEGAVSNIFFVRKNKIYTPQLSCGLLPGILREYVLENFEVNETVIYPEELMYYDECFVTNSLMGVMPVRQLGNICFPHRTRADEVRTLYESQKMSL